MLGIEVQIPKQPLTRAKFHGTNHTQSILIVTRFERAGLRVIHIDLRPLVECRPLHQGRFPVAATVA